MDNEFTWQCPTPSKRSDKILISHGGGGKATSELLHNSIFTTFANPILQQQHDGAVFNIANNKIAFTTDSYVISPLFFPGGDIGSLAVHGTVNDLAMCGARALYISVSFILEEGLEIATLEKVIRSIQDTAQTTGIQVVTGDTKVVERGKGDQIFINTSGIGVIEHHLNIAPSNIQAGDMVLISGDIGRHGIAIMAHRENLQLENVLESDCGDVSPVVQDLLQNGIEIHCLRDLTRGGLVSALVEITTTAQKQIIIEEQQISVLDEVQGVCEILGFDPLYLANEGRFVCFVASHHSTEALQIMQNHAISNNASIIGTVTEGSSQVLMKNRFGVERILDMVYGEQLPRIC